MDLACIRQTALPHTSRLFEDYSYHFDKVARFYDHDPHDPESPVRAASAIDFPDERRAALVAALRRQNGDSVSLDLLAQKGSVAVVTGQQVGLFTGPAYTIFKALTAVKLAQRLKDQGVVAVPVFWLATEDHDFVEVDHAWAFDAAHQPVQFHGSTNDGAGQRPVGEIALSGIPLDQLRDCLEPFAFGSEVADLVAAAYPPGVTLGAGFRTLLSSLLAKYGLLYLDPLASDIRQICAPFLQNAAARLPRLKSILETRNRELTEAGYHAQVHVDAKTSLLFTLAGGRRAPWRGQAPADQPELLSPNALLRPVMQDYLLPTAAYVGGPAELAYLAQSQVLYQELLGHMPVAVHRAGFTLVDARAKKLINRYQLPWSTIYEGEAGIREVIARHLVPPPVNDTFERVEKEFDQSLADLQTVLTGFDPTLAAALTKSAAKVRHQLDRIHRKTAVEALRRDQRGAEEARFLAGLLYPNKHLQERLYTILPFLARHGLDLIDTVYDNIALECPDHQVLTV